MEVSASSRQRRAIHTPAKRIFKEKSKIVHNPPLRLHATLLEGARRLVMVVKTNTHAASFVVKVQITENSTSFRLDSRKLDCIEMNVVSKGQPCNSEQKHFQNPSSQG